MPRATAPAPVDPLADLREPQDGPETPVEPEAPTPTPDPDAEAALDFQGQVAAIVARWHADSTAQSFGHGGGTCGCRYLAAAAVQAIRGG